MLNFINSAEHYRTLLSPFADDPDWEDPATPAPPDSVLWNTTNNPQVAGAPPGVVARTIPVGPLLITFAFFDNSSVQILGGTLDAYTFAAFDKSLFNELPSPLPPGYRPVVVIKMKSRAGSSAPLLTGFVRRVPMGVRVSNIMPPAGATKLQISAAAVSGEPFLLV